MLLVLEAVTMFTDSSGDPCGNDSELNFPQPLRRMIKVFITEQGCIVQRSRINGVTILRRQQKWRYKCPISR